MTSRRNLIFGSVHLQKETLNGRKLTPVLWDTSRSPPKQLAPDPTRSASKTSTHPAVANSNLSSASTSHPPQGGQTSLAQSIAGLSIQQRQQQEAIYYAQQQKQQQQEQQQQAICLAQQQQQQRQPPTTAQQYKIGYTAPAVQQSQTAYSPQSHASAARQAIPSRYVTSGTKQPVNVSNGFAVTVSRGIFVSGLNYKVKESDVKHLFSKIGNVVESRLLCDPSTGKSKGVATVLFSTAKEAQEAIFRYHGALWMEKKIKVRPDTEATTVVEPRREDDTPLIVNGSRRY